MSTVRIYKSTDPGAPAHPSDELGSMAALLRACLVTGYGTGEDFRQPAGWDEPFAESGNYAVFRAASGCRKFYQIDDNQSSANVTVCRSYDSMADVATGMGLRGERYFGKWYNATYSLKWLVIADEKTAKVFLQYRYGLIPHEIGEFYSYASGDPYKSLVLGHQTTTGLPAGYYTPFLNLSSSLGVASQPYIHLDADLYGERAPAGYADAGLAAGLGEAYANQTEDFPEDSGVSYPVIPAFLTCSTPTPINAVRGHLRGVSMPIAKCPKTDGEVFTLDGKQTLVVTIVTSSESYSTQIFVDISGSWEESP